MDANQIKKHRKLATFFGYLTIAAAVAGVIMMLFFWQELTSGQRLLAGVLLVWGCSGVLTSSLILGSLSKASQENDNTEQY